MEYSHVCLEEINRFQHFNKHSFYIESEIMSSLSEKYKHDTCSIFCILLRQLALFYNEHLSILRGKHFNCTCVASTAFKFNSNGFSFYMFFLISLRNEFNS